MNEIQFLLIFVALPTTLIAAALLWGPTTQETVSTLEREGRQRRSNFDSTGQ